jgi:hypothetical protein
MVILEAYTQGLKPVYKSLVILLSIFLLTTLGLYFSYYINEHKNYPIYMSSNSFNDFLNNSNLPQVKSTTVINNVPVNVINSLGNFTDLNYCPKKQCAVNLSTGVKRCPSTVGNQSSSNNDNTTGITYILGEEVCVDSNKCPPNLPYAINNDGSASGQICQNKDFCYCTSKPQCATRVVKYFQNADQDEISKINFSFTTTGNKPDNNVRNSIVIEENTGFCELNPAFSDKIVNGCNFENDWNDAMNCSQTNVYSQLLAEYSFELINYSQTLANFPGLAEITKTTGVNYTEGLNFIGVSTRDNLTNIEIRDVLNKAGSFSLGGLSYFFDQTEYRGPLALLNKISYFDQNRGINVPGLSSNYNAGDIISVNLGILTNCGNLENDNVNYKNMLNCLQPFNQPCTDGVLAYNIDEGNARQFCQASGKNLVVGNQKISDFYLVNPAFFTLSCVTGSGCDENIDTVLCSSPTDCQTAFNNKLGKLFPRADYSALTNLYSVPKSSFGLSFTPIIEVNNGNNQNFIITNNFIPLENGDYWEINSNINDVFLTSNTILGSNILNVNDSSNLKDGLSINFSQKFSISNITGTSVYLDGLLNAFDITIAKTGYQISTYSNNNFFGRVNNVQNFFNKQTFNLFDLDGNILNNDNLNITENLFTVYKQFGFNGLNYNTRFDTASNTRIFSDDYYYKFYNPNITPPFSLFEFFNDDKQSSLLNSSSNFKQKYSMYYPVFNEDYFSQECVYCSPSLQAFPLVTNGSINGINIQFSGQDYYQYVYGNANGNFGYSQTYFGLTSFTLSSNCTAIVLNEAIPGLEVGDYVVDASGFLVKSMVDSSGDLTSNLTFSMLNLNNQTVPDDVYKPYTLSGRVFSPPASFVINSAQQSEVSNVFYGKAYFNNNTEYYIKPTVRIVSFSQDRKTIFTDSQSLKSITSKTVIQFISATNNLVVSLVPNPENSLKSFGTGGLLSIESIADGRICSLKIDNPGVGYSDENKPMIYVTQYNQNSSLLNIS